EQYDESHGDLLGVGATDRSDVLPPHLPPGGVPPIPPRREPGRAARQQGGHVRRGLAPDEAARRSRRGWLMSRVGGLPAQGLYRYSEQRPGPVKKVRPP